MNRKLIVSLLSLTLTCFASNVRAQDADIIATGQKLLKTYSNAIVNVSATIKFSFTGMPGAGGQQQERKQEVLATIIEPSGLAVTSLISLDPSSAYQNIKINRGGETITLTVKSEISEVKYRLADGTEVPGRVVLKDEDLDLAFIAPEKPLDDANKAKITAVSLADAVTTIELLEPVISIGRLGKTLSYEPAVNAARLSAKITKPRIEYIAGGAIGGPSFTRDGKLIGICLMHRSGSSELDLGGGRNPEADQTEVVIPASDIAEVAEQAREEMAKPAPPKPATQPATTQGATTQDAE